MISVSRIKAEALLEEARLRLAQGDPDGALLLAQRAASSDATCTAATDMMRSLASQPTPQLSVIIPTCNRLPILRQCLAHLEAQTLPASTFEVIVVDDASTDATASFLASYAPPFAFRHLLMPERGAPARARNQGIRAARGHIVMFLNDDAMLCPDGLQVHMESHRAVPDMAYSVLGSFSFPPAFAATPWGMVLNNADLIFDYATMRNGATYDFFHYYTCNISTPRSSLIAAGLFDPSFTGTLWGAEDIDIGYRLQTLGLPVVYRSDCNALHQHDLNVDDLARMFKVRGGGAVRIFAKYKELPCHYRDIGAEDVLYWRNLPRRVTEAVEALHERIRIIETFPLPPDAHAVTRISNNAFPELQDQYYGLWRMRSNELLAHMEPLQEQLDGLIERMRHGTQTMQNTCAVLYLAGFFLRWYYDTVGVCAAETIHAVPHDDRCASLRPTPEKPTPHKGAAPQAAATPCAPASPAAGRILLACDFFWPSVGGTELFVAELGHRLQSLGYAVDIACRHLPERLALHHRGMTIHQFRCRDRFHDASMGPDMETYRSRVLRGGYTAVLALAHPDTWVCSGLRHLPEGKRPRIIMMPSMNAENLRLWQERGVLATVQDILRSGDAHITVSEKGVDADMLGTMGITPTFIPHAVTAEASPENMRARLGLRPDVPLLACVGNFWPVKNQLALLQTLSPMPGQWQLVLAGAAMPWQKERDYFMDCWGMAGRDPRIRMTGPLLPADAAALIRDSDILLVPSRGESAGPLVVLQAMAHGVPWIATPECNAVHDEAGGLIAPLSDFPAVVASLLHNPEKARQLAALGQEHWRAAFSWERSLGLFADCIEGRASHGNLRMQPDLRQRNARVQRELFAVPHCQPTQELQ